MRLSGSLVVLAALFSAQAFAQDTLQDMPRYDRYVRLIRELAGSVRSASIVPNWADDGKSFTFSKEGKTYRYDIAARKAVEAAEAEPPKPKPKGRARQFPERGRQFSAVYSPDGKLKAVSRDRNVYLSDADGKNEAALTTDGDARARIKYGVASWVYGEELDVREAMWFSPDSKKLAFYRFDESPVKDYFLAYSQLEIQDTLDQEAYPKAGAPNPKVQLEVVDLATRKAIAIDSSFGDPSLGEYVYDVRWSPDGKELLFNRTDRKQKTMQLCAADPETGASRVVVEEKQPQSWAENHPVVLFLKDGHRFVFSSERNGYKNLYLYDLSGKQLATLTDHSFDVKDVVTLDEAHGALYYTAYSGKPYLTQLHRVGLNGRDDERLTDPDLLHTVSVAPDGEHFVDVAERWDVAPVSKLYDRHGKLIDTLDTSDTTKLDALKIPKKEFFTYKAADGTTDLYGTLQFPSDFDPGKKYPVIVSVYGGPESGGAGVAFTTPSPLAELGFVVANFAGRGTMSRGKAFRDAVYGKLGIVEIDDQAAGVRALAARPYVDAGRVGIYGTSYGGYSTVMALLRHPEAFRVGCASSSVTDWRNYDSIYTERYMGLPDAKENQAGYENGSAMKYVNQLQGNLMLYFGSADNNVHPSNTYQLVQALEDAGKRYDMQVGPDRGHTQMNTSRMWEYFITNLILRPDSKPQRAVWRGRSKSRQTASAAATSNKA